MYNVLVVYLLLGRCAACTFTLHSIVILEKEMLDIKRWMIPGGGRGQFVSSV